MIKSRVSSSMIMGMIVT